MQRPDQLRILTFGIVVMHSRSSRIVDITPHIPGILLVAQSGN
jgi:hypothetical protein